MNLEVDPEDYRCPCCMNYIYINFGCSNKHNVCENCYMKLRKCPICRDETITEKTLNNDITKKLCKNKDRGCNLDLYHFDDEHELECLYNPFHCKFCNMDIIDIKNHYEFNCVNTFKYVEAGLFKNNKNNETEGRKYLVGLINIVPSLINVDDQYYIIMIPKSSQNKVDFYIFSTNNKHELSNYKVKIYGGPNYPTFEGIIYYNKLYCNNIPLKDLNNDKILLTFTIENMFIINRKMTTKKIGNVTYFESNVVDGEPGSAGNWSYKDLEEVTNMFMNIGKK